MQTSDSIAALGAALAKAQADLEGATKDATNPHFRSKYATLASVWEAWKAVGPKNGLSVIQGCTSDGPAVTVMTRLVHSSGEWVESGLTLVARDASPQSIVAACTYGRRAGLSGMVGIAPEDDDGESAQPGRIPAVASPVPLPAASAAHTPTAPPPGDSSSRVTDFSLHDGWARVTIQPYWPDGSGVVASTKKAALIREARAAYASQRPVRASVTRKSANSQDFYLDSIEPAGEPLPPAPPDVDFEPPF